MKRSSLLLFVLICIFPICSIAADVPDFTKGSDSVVENLMAFARENITLAKLSDGSNVPAETEEEIMNPIISMEDGKRVVNRAILTAMAEVCGINWEEESFLPFMESERAKKKWSDKQVAYIGILHGITQGSFVKKFKGQACEEEEKNRVYNLVKDTRP